jgi:hypothetical protein
LEHSALSYLTADWKAIGTEIHDRAHGEQPPKIAVRKDESEPLLPSDELQR